MCGFSTKANRGATAVEFALVLPLLLLILFSIIEYGWYLTNTMVLTNAVSSAARAGVQAREWEGEQPEALVLYTLETAFWLSRIGGNYASVRILSSDAYAPRRIEVAVRSLTYS
jgi:hypothetical protein